MFVVFIILFKLLLKLIPITISRDLLVPLVLVYMCFFKLEVKSIIIIITGFVIIIIQTKGAATINGNLNLDLEEALNMHLANLDEVRYYWTVTTLYSKSMNE